MTYTLQVSFMSGEFDNWDWGKLGALGELGRAAAHGTAQGLIGMAQGGDFGSSFLAGSLGSVGGSVFMSYGGQFATSKIGTYAFSALTGGIGSKLGGGNFWNGTVIGMMNAGLNHLAQGSLIKFRHDKVKVTFDPGADNKINSKLVKYMDIVLDDAYTQGIDEINVSSTTNHPSNSVTSAHSLKNGARAIDINSINGEPVINANQDVKNLQYAVAANVGYRENFGPYLQNKVMDGSVYYWGDKITQTGTTIQTSHQNHIHISIGR